MSIAKKHGIPVVFRSIDVLHELVPSKVFCPFTFALEKWVYKRADKVLVLSPKLSDYVIRMNANKNKVELLLFGVDMNKFNPYVPFAELRKRLGLFEDDYGCTLYWDPFRVFRLDVYLEQFSRVVKKIPKTKLVIVGGGALFSRLKKQVLELKLSDNVILTGFKPFDMMPQFINMADICINPFEVTEATREIIPGKILQYLACGKPVLATPLPGMISLLSGPKQGVIYSKLNEFGEKTGMLLKDAKLAKRVGENGYRYAKDHHNEKEVARRLESILYMTKLQKSAD